ncbi:MAG: efflux RND transporter permease subunit [Proteobacteria bacterium]|nr:efflux RND transporter permease subunit [Pseudomonadota bacterium]
MKFIVDYFLKKAVFVNSIFILMTITGIYCLFSSPVENLPPIDTGMVYITTYFYGASAEDVENLVTERIENSLSSMQNIEFISSESFRNYSTVGVKFIDDTDYRRLFDELRFRILNIQNDFPPEVEDPSFNFIDTHYFAPVIRVNIIGDIPKESQKLLADELKSQLDVIPGLREVKIYGDFKREFHVSVDPNKLRQNGVTFHQVAEAVNSANTKIPTGRFKGQFFQYMLDAGKKFSTQEDVLNVVVRRDGDGNFIRVRDLVTTARLGNRIPYTINTVNGKSSISLIIKKEDSGNAVKIAEHVKDVCAKFAIAHEKDGIEIVLTHDSTVEIFDAINTLNGNLIMGMVLVVIILWITMGFRNAMLSAIGIPFAFLCALIIMRVTHLSINSISLFSFVLISGIIVDDAIIIIENVYRHQQMGKPIRDAVVDGVSEVMIPVISSAMTTIFAFIPMFIMTGVTGEFFSVVPKTVCFALLGSLFEALLILPLHIYEWGPRSISHSNHSKETAEDHAHHLTSGIFAPVWRFYEGLLTLFLNNKKKMLLFTLAAFIISVGVIAVSITGMMSLVKIKFFPDNMMRYRVTVELPTGTSIETTDEVLRELADFILSFGDREVDSASGNAGYYEDEEYQWHQAHNYGQLIVSLPPKKRMELPEGMNKEPMRYIEYVRKKIKGFAESHFTEEGRIPFIRVFAESTSPAKGKDVNIRISGDSLEQNLIVSDEIQAFLKQENISGDLVDLVDNRSPVQKVIKYTPKQEKAFEYGLPPGSITAIVAGALNGWRAGSFQVFDQEIPLMVRLARTDDPVNPRKVGLSDPRDILDIPVIEHSMAAVYLRDLVDMRYANEPVLRSRFNGKPAVTITANIKEKSKLSAGRVRYMVSRYFETISDKYPGATLSYSGMFETTSKAYNSLMYAFVLALLAIYLILAAQFDDYIQPVIVISAVFFSVIGVVAGLVITRSTFTIGSFMSVVGLAGVAVNDSLLLLDFMNVRRKGGKDMRTAVIEACSARMRPILLTTVTTVLGLLPMAIGIPRKSIEWSPMATTFATGLISATVLTLLIVPVEYEIVVKTNMAIKNYFSNRKRRRK